MTQMVFRSICANILGSCFAENVKRFCQFTHKHLIGITLCTAQPMIEMGADHVKMTAFPQQAEKAQQCDGIRPARDSNDHAGAGSQQLMGTAI